MNGWDGQEILIFAQETLVPDKSTNKQNVSNPILLLQCFLSFDQRSRLPIKGIVQTLAWHYSRLEISTVFKVEDDFASDCTSIRDLPFPFSSADAVCCLFNSRHLKVPLYKGFASTYTTVPLLPAPSVFQAPHSPSREKEKDERVNPLVR